jgi:inorganic phosphate transporter, PiT family
VIVFGQTEIVMLDLALPGSIEPAHRPELDKGFNPLTVILFAGILAGGLLYVAYSLYADLNAAGTEITSYVPFLMLFIALLIALGFEFVNGFHDTANAVATVIYTHALPAEFAVVWSGFFNFLGVALSTGAVAFGIISLLPVELILQVGTVPASRWYSRCSLPQSSGTSAPGGSACRLRAPTR